MATEHSDWLKAFAGDPATIYMVDSRLRILYCNAGWERFAEQNGGVGLRGTEQVGRPVLDAIPPPLRDFYQEGYRKVLEQGETWGHDYECSSPTLYRKYRMLVTPVASVNGALVVNSLIVETPFPEEGVAARNHVDANGIVTMCCHCRRTRRAGADRVWDWVPSLVAEPPDNISHGLCQTCLGIYTREATHGSK
jgi:hypothetical protein